MTQASKATLEYFRSRAKRWLNMRLGSSYVTSDVNSLAEMLVAVRTETIREIEDLNSLASRISKIRKDILELSLDLALLEKKHVVENPPG